MRKIKKYIYPLFFSVGFIAFLVAFVTIINVTSSGDGYGGLVFGMLILCAWLIIALPICCIRYSKIIIDEKLKFLFSAYNSLLIIVAHILFLNLQDEIIMVALFSLWVLFWNIVPLVWRMIARKREEKDINEKA